MADENMPTADADDSDMSDATGDGDDGMGNDKNDM